MGPFFMFYTTKKSFGHLTQVLYLPANLCLDFKNLQEIEIQQVKYHQNRIGNLAQVAALFFAVSIFATNNHFDFKPEIMVPQTRLFSRVRPCNNR